LAGGAYVDAALGRGPRSTGRRSGSTPDPRLSRRSGPDDSYILEAGFERLHGVDFRKGCYVGQEVTARMKHKTELRKGLVRSAIAGAAPVARERPSPGRRPRGRAFWAPSRDLRALAHLRFDRLAGPA
jgi:folate-binding protein YgfZ